MKSKVCNEHVYTLHTDKLTESEPTTTHCVFLNCISPSLFQPTKRLETEIQGFLITNSKKCWTIYAFQQENGNKQPNPENNK